MVLLHPSGWLWPGRTEQSWSTEYSLEILIYPCDPSEHFPITTNLKIPGYQCVHSKERTWSGRALLVMRSQGTHRQSDASGSFLKAKQLLSVHTAPQKWPHFKLTLKKLFACLHDGRHHSLYTKDDAAASPFLPIMASTKWTWGDPPVSEPIHPPDKNRYCSFSDYPSSSKLLPNPAMTTACFGPSWHQVSAASLTNKHALAQVP